MSFIAAYDRIFRQSRRLLLFDIDSHEPGLYHRDYHNVSDRNNIHSLSTACMWNVSNRQVKKRNIKTDIENQKS